MEGNSKKKKDKPDPNPSQVFWFSLVKQKIPKELLGTPHHRASLKLRITRRYKMIAAVSSLAIFIVLTYVFGFVLRMF